MRQTHRTPNMVDKPPKTNGTQSTDDVEDDLPPGFEPGFDIDDTKQEQGVQVVTVPGLGEAAVYFADFGTMYEAQSGSGRTGSGGEAILAPRQIARILKKHYVSPSFENVTGEDVKQMKPTKPPQLMNAIANDDVDIDMQADGSAKITSADESDESDEAAGNPA